MITIITGAPGSGKTYYITKFLADNYYEYNKQDNLYYVKNHPENGKPYTIIQNIEGLKLPSLSLDDVILKSKKSIHEFFRKEFQESVAKKYPNIVYIIDECQRYFDEQINKIPEVKFFFEYHRHFGIDIFLLAQNYGRINRNLRGLEELRLHAVKRTFSLFGEFTYNVVSGGENIDKKVLMKKKEVFELYQSRQRKEITKTKNPLIKYIVAAVILGIISFIVLTNTFFKSADSQMKKVEKFDIKKLDEKENKSQEITQEQKQKKYYLRLSLVETTMDNIKSYYYNDYESNQLLPIETIEEPIVTIAKEGFCIKYVVCTFPDPRFIPEKEQIKTADPDSKSSSLDEI